MEKKVVWTAAELLELDITGLKRFKIKGEDYDGNNPPSYYTMAKNREDALTNFLTRGLFKEDTIEEMK